MLRHAVRSHYVLIIVMFNSIQFLALDATVWIAEKIQEDVTPNTPNLQTCNTKSLSFCSITCAKTKGCFSFAFGSGECITWDAKYLSQDQMFQEKTGYVYYHLKVKPEATEIQLYTDLKSFADALQFCQELKQGSLLIIPDQSTLETAGKILSQNGYQANVWIGMNGTVDMTTGVTQEGAATKYDLRWSNGDLFTTGRFNNFIPAEPNLQGQVCIAMTIKGWSSKPYGWTDDPCDAKSYYFCQFAP